MEGIDYDETAKGMPTRIYHFARDFVAGKIAPPAFETTYLKKFKLKKLNCQMTGNFRSHAYF
ncbi:MAG: hypothetical protein JOZ29_14105 [Deltaproteobacteria bacterium]|nr:hypothetical protein [Deltaproteobacteria bacterium]